jgi:CBS domain containing-hemolysin-like protein
MNRVTTTGRGACRTPPTAATAPRYITTAASLAAVLLAPGTAAASFLSGETLDTAANVLAWVVLFLVPAVAITLFWVVHVLPEKIAHKNHHPQRKAIQTLCLLSLVFGGLLWPLAWLWAYTKPVGYKLAYGTDMHEDYFLELTEKWRKGELTEVELRQLKAEFDAVEARGSLTPTLRSLRDELATGGTPPLETAPVAAIQTRSA